VHNVLDVFLINMFIALFSIATRSWMNSRILILINIFVNVSSC